MDNNNASILSKIDLAVLNFTTDPPITGFDSPFKKLITACELVEKYNLASICVCPSDIEYVVKKHPKINICSVISFPLGFDTYNTKMEAACEAIDLGANEIDYVINYSKILNGEIEEIDFEMEQMRYATRGYILKAILETGFLEQQEGGLELIKKITEYACNNCIDFVKTSTGFYKIGATQSAIETMKKVIFEYEECITKIKASGGIKTKKDFEKMYKLGCARIGASNIDCLIT